MIAHTKESIGEALEAITGTNGYYHQFHGPGISFNRAPTPSHFTITPTADGLLVAQTGWLVVPAVLNGRVYFRIIGNTSPTHPIGPLAPSEAFFLDGLQYFVDALDISHPSDWKVTA